MKRVVLTRDPAKDRELIRELKRRGLPYVSVPLVEHPPGPQRAELPRRLGEGWRWVIVTSPTAAHVLAAAWEEAGRPPLAVAALGRGTARVLARSGLAPGFVAPEAYGRSLAETLPGGGRVLWPASVRAGSELTQTLAARGFATVRLDVYTTRPRPLSRSERAQLDAAAVAALASPSAVEAWVARTASRPPAAAIGRVTGEAARAAGFEPVRWPEAPGVAGWAQAVQDLWNTKGHAP